MQLDLAKRPFISVSNPPPQARTQAERKQFSLHWDKGRLTEYYDLTRDHLYRVNYDRSHLNCAEYCSSADHIVSINKHYMAIVDALKQAERATIPSIPCSALKPFWNDHLDDLKQKSIFWLLFDVTLATSWCNTPN